MVEPIGDEQQRLVEEKTEHYICLAEHVYDRSFDRVSVVFDLRGRTAGMFKMVGRERCIRYNPWIFSLHFEENLRDTVPHEVTHYIAHSVYSHRRLKPHGVEWQAVMSDFDADPSVTHNLDISRVPQRSQARHPYFCGCREHLVSTTRHNRVVRKKATYRCQSCHRELVYSG